MRDMRIERYTGEPGSFLAIADAGEVFPCLVRALQHGQDYHDPGIRRLPDGTIQAQKPGGWGKLVHAERLVALLESSDTAVVSVSELNRQGKPHRAGYVGRFCYSDLRIDGEGIRLRLKEQVARAVNIPKSSKPKVRRGRGSY
jgi:hypothetical protein